MTTRIPHHSSHSPQADGCVLAAGRQTPCVMRVPRQAEAFLLVARELDLLVDVARGREAVLRSVEDQDLAVDAQSGNDVRVLRLVPGLVDLLRMVDLLDDIEADGS